MSYQLTTQNGGTEAVIDDNCSISKFYLIADALSKQPGITFLNQVDDADTLNWDFQYNKSLLTLHFSMFNGVSVLPTGVINVKTEKTAVLEVAEILHRLAY